MADRRSYLGAAAIAGSWALTLWAGRIRIVSRKADRERRAAWEAVDRG